MFPYFALLLIPLGLYVAKTWLRRQRAFGVSDSKNYQGTDIIMPSFFIVLLLILAFRAETVGRDLPTYEYYFKRFGDSDLTDIFSSWFECIFSFYNWFVYNFISSNYQIYLAITAILTLAPIAYIYLKERYYSYVQITIFVNMATFVMMFSGIRQSLAFAVGMLAYDALRKKKLKIYLTLVSLATLIHHSGFMLLLMYLLWKVQLQKRDLSWMMILITICYFFALQIANFIGKYLSALGDGYSSKYGVFLGGNVAFYFFILLILFTLFAFIVVDEKKMDDETNALRNFLFFTTLIQAGATAHILIPRLGYYYFLFVPIALAKCMKCASPKYRQVVKLGNVVMCVFFTWYFVYQIFSVYTNYIPGVNDLLGTIPYRFFWE